MGGFKAKTTKQFISDAKKKHGSKYDYSNSDYKRWDEPITIICTKHGAFPQRPGDHIKGAGCPDCGIGARSKKATLTSVEIIKRFKEKHGSNYGYDKVKYKGYHKKVIITCKVHGDFDQTPANHIRGAGCIKCSRIIAVQKVNNARISEDYNFAAVFPEKAKLWHPSKNGNELPKDFLPMSNQKVHWLCEFGHEFFIEISSVSRSDGNGCRKCSSQTSKPELRILSECEYIFSKVISRHRIDNREIDIFMPDLNLGIEFDGSHWHKSREELDQKKNKFLESKKIKLIRIREFPLNKLTDNDICVNQKELTKLDTDRIFRKINFLTNNKFDNEINRYFTSDSFFNEKLFKKYLSIFPSPLPKNALSYTHKDLSKEWDYKKNDPLKPNNFTSGSHFAAWWSCGDDNHPSFIQNIKSRALRGDSCPYCSHQKIIFQDSISNLHPEIAAQWHPKLNGDIHPEEISENSGYEAWWVCQLKGCEYQKVVRHRTIKGQDCKYCFGIKNRKSHKKYTIGHGNIYNQNQIASFENGLKHLNEYINEFGDIYSMTNHFVCQDGFKLGRWVGKVIMKKNTLSEERINTLDSINGWTWSKGQEYAFEKGVKYLKQYLETFSTMEGLKTNYLAPDGYTLGRWVSKKRAQRNTMPIKRVEILESIRAWKWENPRKTKK